MKGRAVAIAGIVILLSAACADPLGNSANSPENTGGASDGSTGGVGDAAGGRNDPDSSTGGELSCLDYPGCDPRPPILPCDLYVDSLEAAGNYELPNLGGAETVTFCVRPMK